MCKYGKLRCNFQGKKTQFINLKLRTIRPIFILISYILMTFGSCDAVMVDVLCGKFQSVVVDVRCGECLIFFLMAFFFSHNCIPVLQLVFVLDFQCSWCFFLFSFLPDFLHFSHLEIGFHFFYFPIFIFFSTI